MGANRASEVEFEEMRSVAEVITKSRATPREFERRLMATLERIRASR